MKTITIELTDLEWQAMADIVIDPEAWAQDAFLGKKNKCIKRVVTKEQQRLLDDPTIQSIPATIEDILESHFAQPNYKSRAERDEISDAALMASMEADTSGSE